MLPNLVLERAAGAAAQEERSMSAAEEAPGGGDDHEDHRALYAVIDSHADGTDDGVPHASHFMFMSV